MAEAKKGGALISREDLEQLWRVLRRNLLLIVAIPLLTGAAGFFYAYKLPKIHGASMQILIKSDETYEYQRQIREQVGFYTKYGQIQNQMRVIQSRDLISKAVKKMDLDVSYHILGRIKSREVFSGMPFKVEMKVLDGNFYNKRIFLKILSQEEYRIHYNLKGGERTVERTLRFGEKAKFKDDFELKVHANGRLEKDKLETLREIDYFFKKHRHGRLISQYLRSMHVKNLEYTSILKLNVTDRITQRAVTFLDTLAKVYIDHTLKQRMKINENTLHYIDKQLDKVRGILKGIEDTLEEYKSRHGILDLNKEKEEYFQKLVHFDQKRRQMELRLESYRSLEDYVEKLNTEKEKLLPSSFYVAQSDEFLKRSVNNIYQLQQQKNSLEYGAKPKNPKQQRIRNNIAELKKDLLKYLENSKDAVKDRIKELKSQISQYEGIIAEIPEKQRGLLNIKRRHKVNEKLYKYLLEKRANTVIARAGIVPDTKIVESARGIGVVRPDSQKYVMMAGGAGLLIALLLAFLRTVYFYKITNLKELKKITVLPVLGQLFRHKQAAEQERIFLIPEERKGIVSESLRSIRANLQFYSGQRDQNIIQVNSVAPGEGKTFVTLNLASIIAKTGQKVLLLELDLHKPRVLKALGLEAEQGVSAYLAGQAEYEEIIMDSGFENLDLAVCGEIPPNASELLMGDRLNELMERAKKDYDAILIDTPPVGVLSDALVVMKHSDINLFVFNTKTSRKQEVEYVEDLIEKHDIKGTGAILNDVPLRKWKGYYGRYSRMYGYGYGYGYYGYHN